MKLHVEPLIKAVARLEEGLVRYQSASDDTQLRDGLIQRFEFTYEISHKLLRRYLEAVSPTPGEYDTADFQYLIRSANEQGLLLGDWSTWKRYREMRAKTSHTYDEEVAMEVVAGIPAFLNESRHLRDELAKRSV